MPGSRQPASRPVRVPEACKLGGFGHDNICRCRVCELTGRGRSRIRRRQMADITMPSLWATIGAHHTLSRRSRQQANGRQQQQQQQQHQQQQRRRRQQKQKARNMNRKLVHHSPGRCEALTFHLGNWSPMPAVQRPPLEAKQTCDPPKSFQRKLAALALLLLSASLAEAGAASEHPDGSLKFPPTVQSNEPNTRQLLAQKGGQNNHTTHLSGQISSAASRIKVPGLYDERQDLWIRPLQGQTSFEQSIYNASTSTSTDYLGHPRRGQSAPGEQTISLVQYYMATCPDCQGFSPYFKRFVSDIGPHWRRLVRVYTINCNDEININLCWQQNPNLIVPLVRWYTFPQILADSKRPSRQFGDYPVELLNVAHRSFIKRQRRDLISLRHATLRYIRSILEQINRSATASNSSLQGHNPIGTFYFSLPISLRLLRPIGAESSRIEERQDEAGQFLEAIIKRTEECSRLFSEQANFTVENFIVFEKPGSYAGMTLVADWSNYSCAPVGQAHRKFMFHYSDNLDLLASLNIVDTETSKTQMATSSSSSSSSSQLKTRTSYKEIQSRQPLLVSVDTKPQMSALDQLEFRLLAFNNSAPLSRRSRRHVSLRVPEEHLNKPLPSKLYYANRKPRDSMAKQLSTNQLRATKRRMRRSSSASNYSKQIIPDYNEAENINWGPEYIYPGEEPTRYRFNQIVAHRINKSIRIDDNDIPGANLRGENPGEIARIKPNTTLIEPKDDDLTLLRLTDYYKVLDEIIHKNILSRAEVDGYQLISSTCFVRHLSRLFPFQGQQGGQQKSVARNYLELMYQRFSELLVRKNSSLFQACSGDLLQEQRDEFDKLKVNTKTLQEIQSHLRREFDIGLPSEKHFKWQYCAGSSDYLRGHTCSLWILFHTLTVHEYLDGEQGPSSLAPSNCSSSNYDTEKRREADEQYKFMIKYSEERTRCDPLNPEPALVGAKASELFESPMHSVLANIINFVRYYLSCTNCAAHFNCMVLNSGGLDLCRPRADDHLLWLWEAHNRVNVRTRSTHSEDPSRPKHVFPVYEACPECYLEQPSQGTAFELMKFNRKALVEFLVARYRKSAILNNKIKIEDLFRKPAATRAAAEVNTAAAGNNKTESNASTGVAVGGESFKLSQRLTSLVM